MANTAEPSSRTGSHQSVDLEALLTKLLERPYEREELERQIEEAFAQECAVMVLDMTGFSRITHDHGIVAYLLMIHQMRLLAIPIVEEHGGAVVEAKADDLLCVFEDVEKAVNASRRILEDLETANVVLPDSFSLYASIGIGWGRILRIGSDRVAGDQVNLAAKLGEDVADHGEVLLTREAQGRFTDSVALRRRRAALAELEFDYFVLST